MKAILRPVYRSARAILNYFRAPRILRDYATHYAEAQQLFVSEGNTVKRLINNLNEVRVRVLAPDATNRLVDLPAHYSELIARLRADVQARLQISRNCMFFPKLDSHSIPEETSEIGAIKDGEVVSLQLKHYVGLDGLQDLCSHVMQELEQKVYGSHVIVDKVYIYRSLVSHQRERVSWLWHYDNHPNEILKIMIYLTDVDEESGPFEYLRSSQSHHALCVRPKPLVGSSRLSARALRSYFLNGYEGYKVTGCAGTIILFDDNVMHRANIAKKAYRDVIVLQIRPATFRPEIYIDPKWTGSFEDVDFNPDPYDYRPRVKASSLSG